MCVQGTGCGTAVYMRYSRVYKVALAYPVVSTGHQMWCTRVVRPPFPGNLREFQRQFTTEGVCQTVFRRVSLAGWFQLFPVWT